MAKLFCTLVILASSALARAQADSPALPLPTVEHPPAQTQPSPETNLKAEILVSVDAGKAKPGDMITAKVRSDALEARQTLLPYGATLIGLVKDVRGRSKEQSESMLSVCFDKARLQDGTEVPVNLLLYRLVTTKTVQGRRSNGSQYTNNISNDRMAPPRSLAPNQTPSPGAPERNPGSYSPRAQPPEQRSSTALMPSPGSGQDGVIVAPVRQHTASFAVLTSDSRNVRVSKHDLFFFRIVQ